MASLGYEMVDDVEDYDGIHGLLVHKNPNGGFFVKLGYHEGLVDAKTWLEVQDKKEHNHRIPHNRKGNKSWLTGIVKCACCGYTMKISSRRYTKAHKLYHYYYDAGKKSKCCFRGCQGGYC